MQRTQTLRVGYGRDNVPFAYRNANGDLVGYDVACAYDLARALNVKLVFVPVEFYKVKQDVEQGLMDIWIGGVYVMEYRMVWGSYSQPYYQSPLALILPSQNTKSYLSMDQIKADPDFTLAIVDNPTLHILADRLFPDKKRITVPSYDVLPHTKGWSAALWTLEECRVWAAGHPGYSALRPKNMGSMILYAYVMHKGSANMVQFVNHWLTMRKVDGFVAKQRAYWIEGAATGAAH